MDLSHYPYNNWVIVGILGFFAVRMAIGYWASRHVSNAADYIVAGRGMPIYMTSASIMATWFAAETLMGASSKAYTHGFQGIVFDPFGAVLCLFVSGLFFIRLMRRARYLTVVDFFEKRFGLSVGSIGAVIQIVAYLVWTAAQFVAGSKVVHSLLDCPPWVGVIVVGLIVTGYTTMGGMLADTLLDFIQMFFTAGGITVVFLYVLQAVGGVDGLVDHGGARHVPAPYTIFPLGEPHGYLGYTGHMGTFYWIAAWLTIGLGSVATQDLMQRSMSARNEATSVWGSYFAAVLYFTFGVMSPLIGIMMHKLNPNIPEEQVESLLLMVSQQYLPVWLNVLFIAALTSAMMSTSDSAILAGASVFTENLLPRFHKHVDEVQKLWWTRLMVVVIGCGCIGIALAIGETYRLALMAWSVPLVGLFVPFAFGMYWRKANRNGALASILGGIATWVVASACYYPHTAAEHTANGEVAIADAMWDAVYIASTPAFAVSLVLMVVVSLLTQRANPPQPLTDVDGQPLEMRRRLGLVSLLDVFRREPANQDKPA
ncbi:MAG: sodium:solute symporter family protein [Planctomycetes bacterium]|nr:sodium:solute symporter family protein [Planctomycetota bacterium]